MGKFHHTALHIHVRLLILSHTVNFFSVIGFKPYGQFIIFGSHNRGKGTGADFQCAVKFPFHIFPEPVPVKFFQKELSFLVIKLDFSCHHKLTADFAVYNRSTFSIRLQFR